MNRLQLLRRTIHLAVLTSFPLLPLLGLTRIDVERSNLTIFGLHIWAHEATLVVLIAAVGLALLALLSAIGGRVFCGWLCPQTALSELATFVESRVRRSLGRGSWVEKAAAVTVGAAIALAASAVGGLAIVTFFVPSSAFATLLGPQTNTSLLKGLTIATIMVFVVAFVFRHMFCKWMCLFGWWQRLFTGARSLRIAFDVGRSKSCTNCGGCSRACFMKLEPRRRVLPATCLNCAKCVIACEREMGPSGTQGLIALGFPKIPKERSLAVGRSCFPARGRLVMAALLATAAAASLALAAASRQPVQVVVRQAERLHVGEDGTLSGVFYVDVYNNRSQPVSLSLNERRPEGSEVEFFPSRLVIAANGSGRSDLRISGSRSQGLAPGRHTLTIVAVSEEPSGSERAAEGRIVFAVPPLPDRSDYVRGLSSAGKP